MLIFSAEALYPPRMAESFYDHNKVAELRKSVNMTKPQMAERLGVTLMTVYRVEEGRCSLELLANIAILFDVPLIALLHPTERIAKNFVPA